MFYVVDRIEGKVAVVVADDGVQFNVPRALLPKEAREGSVMRVLAGNDRKPDWKTAELDTREELRLRAEGEKELEKLRKRDPGGDIVT